jgi:hypothetical protein
VLQAEQYDTKPERRIQWEKAGVPENGGVGIQNGGIGERGAHGASDAGDVGDDGDDGVPIAGVAGVAPSCMLPSS